MPRANRRLMEEYRTTFTSLLGDLGREGRRRLLQETRARARADLHFFAAVVMGCVVMTPRKGLHGRICAFLQDEGEWPRAKYPRKWLQIFRGALKSTLGTVGWSLQAVVRDPEERVLIMSATHPLSKSFLREIKRHIEGKAFQVLFPELTPDKSRWNQEEAALLVGGKPRHAREPNFGTAGLDVGVTGTHWSRVVYDDLVVPENVGTRAAARAVIDKFKMLRPLLDTWDAAELMVGTPYESYDLYAWLERRQGWFVRMRVPLLDEEGRCVWPEEFPSKRVAELRELDYRVFMSQYMLDPRPAGTGVAREEQFLYWARPGEAGVEDFRRATGCQVACVVEPSKLTYYAAWDPSAGVEGGDEAAIVVVGVDEARRIYVCEVYNGLMSVAEQIETLFRLAEAYQPYGGLSRVIVEQAGGFAALAAMLEDEMAARNKQLWVEKADATQAKETRVRVTLAPLYGQGRILHHWTLRNSDMEGQLLDFPAGADDVVDALTYACGAALKYGAIAPTVEQVNTQALAGFGLYPTIAYTYEQLQRLTLGDIIKASDAYREMIQGGWD